MVRFKGLTRLWFLFSLLTASLADLVRLELTVKYATSPKTLFSKCSSEPITGHARIWIKRDPDAPLPDDYVNEQLYLGDDGIITRQLDIDLDGNNDKKFWIKLQMENNYITIASNQAAPGQAQLQPYWFRIKLRKWSDFNKFDPQNPAIRVARFTHTIPMNYRPDSHEGAAALGAYDLIFMLNLMHKIGDRTRRLLQMRPNLPEDRQIKVNINAPYIGPEGTSYRAVTTSILLELVDVKKPTVLAHEYGHFIMTSLYGGVLANSAPGTPHKSCTYDGGPQAAAMMWSEGYATGFGLILCDLIGLPNPGIYDTKDRELYKCIENTYPNNHGMLHDEGRISATLWDLYDGAKAEFQDNEITNQGDPALGSGANPAAFPFDPLGSLGDRNQDPTHILSPYQILIAPLFGAPNNRKNDVHEYYLHLISQLPAGSPKLLETQRIFCYNYLEDPICT